MAISSQLVRQLSSGVISEGATDASAADSRARIRHRDPSVNSFATLQLQRQSGGASPAPTAAPFPPPSAAQGNGSFQRAPAPATAAGYGDPGSVRVLPLDPRAVTVGRAEVEKDSPSLSISSGLPPAENVMALLEPSRGAGAASLPRPMSWAPCSARGRGEEVRSYHPASEGLGVQALYLKYEFLGPATAIAGNCYST